MSEAPVPDVMDNGGRLNRLVYALIAGAIATAVTYFICDGLAKPQPGPSVGGQYSHGAYKFVYYMTALAGGAAFLIVGGLLEGRAKKRWLAEQEIAHARALKK